VPKYFEKGDKLQLMFNFLANQHVFLALARGAAEPIPQTYDALPAIPEICQWANFLRNHDELDLGRLSDEERSEVFAQFAPDEHMRLYNRGIRRRLAPMLANDRRRLECAYSLMLSLPGTPVLRYGDEIGMGDDLSLPERQSVRTPMQWDPGKNGGFSTADASKLIHPAISEGEYGYEKVNVDAQQRDPESLLSWTERMLRLRRTHSEFGWGKLQFIKTGNPGVLAHRMEHNDNRMLVVHNVSAEEVTVDLELPAVDCLEDLLTREPSNPAEEQRYRLQLGPYGYRWFAEKRGSNG
jgi:maltose alpha-D-glucosyltransferase/alpha-amylase